MGIVILVGVRARPLRRGKTDWRWQPGALGLATGRTRGVLREDVRDRDDNSNLWSAVLLCRVRGAREMSLRDDVLALMRSPRVAR